MKNWSNEKLDRELAFRDTNGGDPAALAWVQKVEAEATRRGIAFDPLPTD